MALNLATRFDSISSVYATYYFLVFWFYHVFLPLTVFLFLALAALFLAIYRDLFLLFFIAIFLLRLIFFLGLLTLLLFLL